MKQLSRVIVIALVTCLMTSCAAFRTSSKDDAFCSTSAFIDTQEHKPAAPTTPSDREFHVVAGANVVKHNKVINSYDMLRECWEYWVAPAPKSK